jgi:hypothetical protein
MQLEKEAEIVSDIGLEGLEQVFAVGHLDWVSISEGSRRLDIPYTTLRRQVKEGKFQTQTTPDGRVLIGIEIMRPPNGEKRVTAGQVVDNSGGQIEAPNQTQLLEFIATQMHQLQEASCRIGWLEAKLEEMQNEVKLLTDNKKRRWWHWV